MADALDHAPWSSLDGDHRHLGIFDDSGRAAKYKKEVGLFGGLAEANAAGWDAAATITREGGIFGVFQAGVELPGSGWEVLFNEYANQFVAGTMRDEPVPADGAEVVQLGEGNIDAMVELTALAQPGPFKAGTAQMGKYFGIIGFGPEEGRLLAMAGQRFHPAGYIEVSAVCTHPDAQRRGYGGALTRRVVDEIRASGREAILHTRHNNDNARRLYEAMGFEFRKPVDVVVARRHPAG